MADKKTSKPVAEKKPVAVLTPLEQAKRQQFKRMFPNECRLLIAEYEAGK